MRKCGTPGSKSTKELKKRDMPSHLTFQKLEVQWLDIMCEQRWSSVFEFTLIIYAYCPAQGEQRIKDSFFLLWVYSFTRQVFFEHLYENVLCLLLCNTWKVKKEKLDHTSGLMRFLMMWNMW